MVRSEGSPVAKAMALAAVAIGSMNPRLAVRVTGKTSKSGLISRATARAATMGSMAVSVATFDIISVAIKVISRRTTRIRRGWYPCSPCIARPSHCDRPVLSMAAAIDRPPPKRTTMPQGMRSALDQSSRRGRSGSPDGRRNSRSAPAIATPMSLSLSSPGIFTRTSSRSSQADATATNTIRTRFSAGLAGPSASRARRSTSRPLATSSAVALTRPRVTMSHRRGRRMATTGIPSIIHWTKESGTPRSSRNAMAMTLVGDPTGVPMPPMDAA